jgi:hypothetical protein
MKMEQSVPKRRVNIEFPKTLLDVSEGPGENTMAEQKIKVPSFSQSTFVCQGQRLFDRHLVSCTQHHLRNVRISIEYQKQQQQQTHMTVKTTPK